MVYELVINRSPSMRTTTAVSYYTTRNVTPTYYQTEATKYYVEPTYYTTGYAAPSCYFETANCTTASPYYTTTYAYPTSNTEALKYYAALCKY